MTTTTEEDQYLRRILALLDSARPYESLTQSNSKQWQVQPGSALAGDDAKTDPYQASHNSWNALSAAVDHLHCFRSTFGGLLLLGVDRAGSASHDWTRACPVGGE